jgi:hypothetical protein
VDVDEAGRNDVIHRWRDQLRQVLHHSGYGGVPSDACSKHVDYAIAVDD